MCEMRELEKAYCEVCVERSIQRFYENVSLIDAVQPAARRIQLQKGAGQLFKVNSVGPQRNFIQGEWFLNGKRFAGVKSSTPQGPAFELDLTADQLPPGQYTVRFLASDRTRLIRNQVGNNPTATRKPNVRFWYVNVRDPGGLPGLQPAPR
jgi:hypothetical protein